MPGANDLTSGTAAPHGDQGLRAWSEGKHPGGGVWQPGLPGTKAGGEGTLEPSVPWETRSSHVHSSRRVSVVGDGPGRSCSNSRPPGRGGKAAALSSEGWTPRPIQEPHRGEVQDLKPPREEAPQTYPAPGAASDHSINVGQPKATKAILQEDPVLSRASMSSTLLQAPSGKQKLKGNICDYILFPRV